MLENITAFMEDIYQLEELFSLSAAGRLIKNKLFKIILFQKFLIEPSILKML